MPIIRKDDVETLQDLLKSVAPDTKKTKDLSIEDATAHFFEILQRPECVSHISKTLAAIGYAQGNLAFRGARGAVGDEVILSRWKKASSGSVILVTRTNSRGILEVLFGKKRVPDQKEAFWSLPGGHYELDSHDNMEHTLVSELMEETGIVPMNDEFLPYIKKTIQKEAKKLPYKSFESIPERFICRDFEWDVLNVISGSEANWTKRCINANYHLHLKDVAKLRPLGSDDLGKLKWFPITDIFLGNKNDFPPGMPIHEDRVYLSSLRYGNGLIIEQMMRKQNAWKLASKLEGRLVDIANPVNYLIYLESIVNKAEAKLGLTINSLLKEFLVGEKHIQYGQKILTLHHFIQNNDLDFYALKKKHAEEIVVVLGKN